MFGKRAGSDASTLRERTARSGRKPADSTVGPHIVEVVSPKTEGPFCMAQAVEHFFVQQLVSELAVKALRKAILLRLAWGDVMPADARTILTLKHGARHKFCPIIRHDHFRLPVKPDDPVQLACDTRT